MIKVKGENELRKGHRKRVGVVILFYFLFIYFSGCAGRLAGSVFPNQGSNPCPLQWKRKVLTSGPPGNSRAL